MEKYHVVVSVEGLLHVVIQQQNGHFLEQRKCLVETYCLLMSVEDQTLLWILIYNFTQVQRNWLTSPYVVVCLISILSTKSITLIWLLKKKFKYYTCYWWFLLHHVT